MHFQRLKRRKNGKAANTKGDGGKKVADHDRSGGDKAAALADHAVGISQIKQSIGQLSDVVKALMSNGVRTRSANAAVTVDRPASSPFQELLIASRDHPPSDPPAGSATDQM